MEAINRLKTAYTLLPPPLAALPAKYWTSISLLIHSYTVGRTFETFVEGYSSELDNAPPAEEAFLIGFLHDMGQKLGLLGKPSEEKVIRWFSERLETLGFTKDDVRTFIRYLYTNPAETRTDPLYPSEVWTLLWLADRLQGISNPIDVMHLLNEAKRELKHGLSVKLLTLSLPQPFLRTLISKAVYEHILKQAMVGTGVTIPISTPMGVVLITDNPDMDLTISWDEIRQGFTGEGILEENVEGHIIWNMNCCDDKNCYRLCGGKTKTGACSEHGFVKRECDEGVYLDERGNSYRITLIYYGRKHRVDQPAVLPSDAKNMIHGINLSEVEYANGDHVCPICGIKTPVGVAVGFIKFFTGKKIKTEKWVRKFYPTNVNALLQNTKNYALDPLCLGDVIIRGSLGTDIVISLTLRPPLPSTILGELASLTWAVYDHLGKGIPRSGVVNALFYSDNWDKGLASVLDKVSSKNQKVLFDMFSSTAYIPYRSSLQSHQDEWLIDMVTAGVLASWGIYPLTLSPAPPMAPVDTLLSYYKGQKPLYDFRPSDRDAGVYTPYVSAAMASLAELNFRKDRRRENLPALLEVLDYPPHMSPPLAQYGSPHLYSVLEMFRMRLGGV